MGDVKLAFVMGLFLGRDVGVAHARRARGRLGRRRARSWRRKGVEEGRKTAMPFGPFLALGGLVGLLAGEPIVDWYLRHLRLTSGRHGVLTPQVATPGCR